MKKVTLKLIQEVDYIKDNKKSMSSISGNENLIRNFHKKVGLIKWNILEEFILKKQHIWRPIRGHCFETWFDKLITLNGYDIKSVGGDDTVDRILKGKRLQLKTPYNNGTIKNRRVAFSLHKTHGLEKKPHNLYKPENFADFLIGLHPNGGIIICPVNKIPLDKNHPKYLADPVYFSWDNEWLNRFDLLDIKIKKFPQNRQKNKLFPRICKETNLDDIDIIQTLLKPENFRVF